MASAMCDHSPAYDRAVPGITDDEAECWICHGGHSSNVEPLEVHCGCKSRPSHATCLLRWQLVCLGRSSEETSCRFCGWQLPSWESRMASLPLSRPTIKVVCDNEESYLQVSPGLSGMLEFQETLRQRYGLAADDAMTVNFECFLPQLAPELSPAPPSSVSDVPVALHGWGAYDAAVKLAQVRAGARRTADGTLLPTLLAQPQSRASSPNGDLQQQRAPAVAAAAHHGFAQPQHAPRQQLPSNIGSARGRRSGVSSRGSSRAAAMAAHAASAAAAAVANLGMPLPAALRRAHVAHGSVPAGAANQ